MRLRIFLASSLLLTGVLAAQSSTMPRGWDTTEGGLASGAGGNDYFWTGFDTGSAYNPAKAIYVYDQATFPWNPTQDYEIKKLSFRRDGLYSRTVTTTGALTKKWTIIISTNDDVTAGAQDFNHYDRNHGTNKAVVFGAIGTGKDVVLPATVEPPTGTTAPFNAVVTLDTPFKVPAFARSLVVEIRCYGETVQTAGWWRADTVLYDGTGYTGGSFSLINTDHCVSPSILYTSRAAIYGSTFSHIWRTYQSPGGKTMLSWLGPQATTPIPFPGSPKCMIQVFPVLAITTTTTGVSGQFAGIMDWGRIPDNPAFFNAEISHQSLVVDSTYPGGVGLTRGATSKMGRPYDSRIVKGSCAYSYGANTAMYTGSSTSSLEVDPDLEVIARYLYRRVLVMQIN